MGILTSPKASEPFHIARAIASASLRKSVQNPSQPSARHASHPKREGGACHAGASAWSHRRKRRRLVASPDAKAEPAAPELPLGGITGREGGACRAGASAWWHHRKRRRGRIEDRAAWRNWQTRET